MAELSIYKTMARQHNDLTSRHKDLRRQHKDLTSRLLDERLSLAFFQYHNIRQVDLSVQKVNPRGAFNK